MFLFNRLRHRQVQPIEQPAQGFVLVSNIPPLHTAAWDVCLLTKTLSIFLYAHELCALSTCASFFVPFRRQFQSLMATKGITKVLLKQMRSDALWRVTNLGIDTCIEKGISRDDIGDLFAVGSHRLRNLRSLSFYGEPHNGLPTMELFLRRFLGAEGKSRLKSLSLVRGSLEDEVLFSVSDFNALFADLSGLETLELWQTGCNDVLLPSLAGCLGGGRLPSLCKLIISICPIDRGLDYRNIALVLTPILNGRVPHLKEVELSCNYFTDEFIDLLLQLSPLLEKLDLHDNSFTEAGEAIMWKAAAQHPGLTLLLPPRRLKQLVQYPDPASLTTLASLSPLAAEVWHFFISSKSLSPFLDLVENVQLSSCTSVFSPFRHQIMCCRVGKWTPELRTIHMRKNILSEITNLVLSDEYPLRTMSLSWVYLLLRALPRLESLQIDGNFCLYAPYVLKDGLSTAGRAQLKYLRVTGGPFEPTSFASPSPSAYTYVSLL
jgi:hypothetical protein